jgi:hypothetical protein
MGGYRSGSSSQRAIELKAQEEIKAALREEERQIRRAAPDAADVNQKSLMQLQSLLNQESCFRCGGAAEGWWLKGSQRTDTQGKKINHEAWIELECHPTPQVISYFKGRVAACDHCGLTVFGPGGMYQLNNRLYYNSADMKKAYSPKATAQLWKERQEMQKTLAVMIRRDPVSAATFKKINLPLNLLPTAEVSR